jgi:hypothetical protein
MVEHVANESMVLMVICWSSEDFISSVICQSSVSKPKVIGTLYLAEGRLFLMCRKQKCLSTNIFCVDIFTDYYH